MEFWKSPAGAWTAIGLGALGLGGLIYLVTQPPQAAPAVSQPPAPGGWYYFTVSTSYQWNDGTGQAQSTIKQALANAGFSAATLQVYGDPTNPQGWVGTGQWSAPAGVTSPSLASGTGVGSFTALTAPPPTPQTQSGLVAGSWYALSFRTSFMTSTQNAQMMAANVLSGFGFANAQVAAAQDSSSWNAIAQWQPSNGATSFSDEPPLLQLLAFFARGTTQPAAPQAGAAIYTA